MIAPAQGAFVLFADFYDRMAMRIERLPIVMDADDDYVHVLQPGFHASVPRGEIDFTKDLVRVGQVDVDSDALRWKLEERGL